jgi:hypothetical protein
MTYSFSLAGKITGMILEKPVQDILAYCANRDFFYHQVQAAHQELQLALQTKAAV